MREIRFGARTSRSRWERIRFSVNQNRIIAHHTGALAGQAAYLDLMRTHPLVFGIGPAGTGKTYLAASFGAHLLHERRIERLILSRPPWKQANDSDFCPAISRRRSIPIFARSMTRCSTFSRTMHKVDGAGND